MTLNSDMFPDIQPGDTQRQSPDGYSALALAFIGDAVYELLVRSYIIGFGNKKVAALHEECIQYVNADFQAQAGEKLLSVMTDDEAAVYRRAKNAHPAHVPKNKSVMQYQKATAFEAVTGWLYLKKDFARINEFFDIVIKDKTE